jgi:hypothetical protein
MLTYINFPNPWLGSLDWKHSKWKKITKLNPQQIIKEIKKIINYTKESKIKNYNKKMRVKIKIKSKLEDNKKKIGGLN